MIKQKFPKISIITPSYNSSRFIERTIRSVLGQKYPNLEYIIVDGGSKDGTLEILKKYPQIKWLSEKDEGQSDAINKGLKMSTGDIVAYLNADDLYRPKALFKVANYFEKHPDIVWVTGKCRITDEKNKEIQKWITTYKNFWLKKYSYNKLLVINFISQPATFWRRKLLKEIGYFDKKQHLVMDYQYWLKIGKKYKLGFINHYLADFRVHQDSKSSQLFIKQFKEEYQTAKLFTNNKFLIFLHWLHIHLIYLVYKIIK